MIDLTEEIQWIKDSTKSQIKRFKLSGYPIKHCKYIERVRKDYQILNTFQVDTQYANIPLHPSFQKYLARERLEKLGISKDEILVVLEEIFNQEFKSLPSLRKDTREKYEKNIEQRLLWQSDKALKEEYEKRKIERQFEYDRKKFNWYKEQIELLEDKVQDLKKQNEELKCELNKK